MQNQKLDELTTKAERVATSLEPLLVDGHGKFRDAAGAEVPATEILRRITVAHDDAHDLWTALRDEPRRRVAAKPGEGGAP